MNPAWVAEILRALENPRLPARERERLEGRIHRWERTQGDGFRGIPQPDEEEPW